MSGEYYSTQTETEINKRRMTFFFQNWSSLNNDLLESIFDLLPIVDMLRIRGVCSPWRSLAKTHIKSRLIKLKLPLFLVLPRRDDADMYVEDPEDCGCERNPNVTYRIEKDNRHIDRLYSPEDKSFYRLANPLQGDCVGSFSRGWLMMLYFSGKKIIDDQGGVNLFMYSPLLEIKIYLPSPLRSPIYNEDSFPSSCIGGCNNRGKHWIQKATLVGLDDGDLITSNRYGLVIIYGPFSKLAFLMCGETQWRSSSSFDDEEGYVDLTCYKNSIFALTKGGSVDVWKWDFSSFDPTPTRKMNIPPSLPDITKNNHKSHDLGEYLYVAHTKRYIIPTHSHGEILLVERCIGQFVPVRELFHVTISQSYFTAKFYVHRMNFDKPEWIRLENIGDRLIFVGVNQSVSFSAKDFPGCEKNSIYFTDDYWEKIDENPLYGGHDMGFFNLEDEHDPKRFHDILRCKRSPAFWLLP
ncbi:hypothetical protein ACH5RR_032599 [Cinchona calisaya]|uniref:F-box domain-containing protein n=1 Tax=Cinchona calisaya TaxID=153742 RepID=A0ABD2YIL3_9GENT